MSISLKELYYDPETGYCSASKLYQKAKDAGLKYTHREIKEFLASQETVQLHKPVSKKKVYNHILARFVNDCWQADLMDMSSLSKFNSGYKWILTIVDVYSRYGWAIPLKSKKVVDVLSGFNSIDCSPDNITTDNGNEFRIEFDAKHWTNEPGDHNKMGIIERFNKTVRIWLNKYMTANNTRNWKDVLPKFAKNYNNSIHSFFWDSEFL